MIMEFTCEDCGAKVTREYKDPSHAPRLHLCDACRYARKLVYNRAWSAKARAMRRAQCKAKAYKKCVKKCHRCGRTFEERPMPTTTISAANAPYFSHRYCPSCTWAMKRAARSCDPRYSGVGGHGDILDGVRAVDIRKAGET